MREQLIPLDQIACRIVDVAIDQHISAISRVVDLPYLPQRQVGRLDEGSPARARYRG